MLQQRANLVLGLTYFDLGEFENAVQYLEKVDAGNENYPKALIGIGWCYLKLQQFQRVIEPLEQLLDDYPKHNLVSEACLLLGQAHLKIRLYDKAITYFSELLKKYSKPQTGDKTQEEMKQAIESFQTNIESQRLDLLLLETKLIDTFHLTSQESLPEYMIQVTNDLRQRRSKMTDQISSEKRALMAMNRSVERFNRRLDLFTNDWRSYAEYGISLALFLKGQAE